MNTYFLILLNLVIFITSACTQNVDKQLNESRSAIQALASNLQQTLKSSMQTGGPIKALEVCNIEAEKIATIVSTDLEAIVGRTSLKVRNPKNIPDAWEEEVLLYFEQQKINGADLKTLELYEITKNETGKWFRYMKAIPISDVCLICHGENVAPDIQENLHILYPNDQAKGYKAGDLRGAFTVKLKL
ncbi:MAG: DUF3365 domain-containing protein [Pseudomonadota bacterium]